MKNNFLILALLGVFVFVIFSYKSSSGGISESAVSSKKVETVSLNVEVSKPLIDDKGEYSLSVPTTGKSSCEWNWDGGSGMVPYSKTTNSDSQIQKHTVEFYSNTYNYQVQCTDEIGNKYVGKFPKETSIPVETTKKKSIPQQDQGAYINAMNTVTTNTYRTNFINERCQFGAIYCTCLYDYLSQHYSGYQISTIQNNDSELINGYAVCNARFKN